MDTIPVFGLEQYYTDNLLTLKEKVRGVLNIEFSENNLPFVQKLSGLRRTLSRVSCRLCKAQSAIPCETHCLAPVPHCHSRRLFLSGTPAMASASGFLPEM